MEVISERNCRFELMRRGKSRESYDPGNTSEAAKSNILSLEKKNSEQHREIDLLQLEILSYQESKEEMASLQEEHSSLVQKYKKEKQAHRKKIQHLQQQLDQSSLARRKMEEHILLTGSSEVGVSSESKNLLHQIQEKYSEEVSNLSSEIRVKDKSLQELRTKKIALVRKIGIKLYL